MARAAQKRQAANPSKGIKFVLGIIGRGADRVSEVQSVLFEKARWSVAQAHKWLREHGFKTPKVDKGGGKYMRFRQAPPREYDEFRYMEPGQNPDLLTPVLIGAAAGTSGAVVHDYLARRRQQGTNPRTNVTCYGQVRGRDWVQESYETASGDARKRAAQLRKLGYRVTVSSMGTQVTPVGTVKMTLVDVRPGARADLADLPAVHVERMNPITGAAELSEAFHGRPARSDREVIEELQQHGVLADLGGMEEIRMQRPRGVRIRFGHDTRLASNEEGTQLFLVGGDQSVDLDAFDVDDSKESVVLGPVDEIVYNTAKQHLGAEDKRAGPYKHRFGEEGGDMPVLIYDTVNELLSFSGGTYRIDRDIDGKYSAGIRD